MVVPDYANKSLIMDYASFAGSTTSKSGSITAPDDGFISFRVQWNIISGTAAASWGSAYVNDTLVAFGSDNGLYASTSGLVPVKKNDKFHISVGCTSCTIAVTSEQVFVYFIPPKIVDLAQ
jgi:hypothetical protein